MAKTAPSTASKTVEIGLIRGRFDDRAWRPLAIEGAPSNWLPHAGFLGRRAAVICHDPYQLPYRLFVQDGDRLVPGPALPEPGPCGRPFPGKNGPRVGFAVLASGEPLIMWDGDLYHVGERALTKRFATSAPRTYENPETIATPEGRLLFFSNRRLYEVRADGTTVAHARDLENIMKIARGPEGTLLLMQGTNPEDDIGKIYYPADGSWASLTRELFGFADNVEYFTSVFWSQRTDLVVAQSNVMFHAVPTRAVLELERTAPGGRRRPAVGYVIAIVPAAGHHDRVAALSPCYVGEVEARLEMLLLQNNNPRPSRPFMLGLAIAANGAVADVKVLDTDADSLAVKFADEIREQPSPFFYPPATGAIQLEISIEFVTRRLRKSRKA